MSRRVRYAAAALLAFSLVINVPVASAAVRDTDGPAGVGDRIIQIVKKILKPLTPLVNGGTDPEFKPSPPKP